MNGLGLDEEVAVRVQELANTFDLPDSRVWIMGDLHGNVGWLQTLFPAMRRHDPQLRTVLQLGDFGYVYPDGGRSAIDYWAKRAGIERVLVTLGNHEAWGSIAQAQADAPGQAIRVSDVVWLLPRPVRFSVGGRRVLSLGGAVSVDRHLRKRGVDWFEEEVITAQMAEAAIAGGPADVMLTHEPGATVVPEVEAVLAANPHRFPQAALADSARSRARIEGVWGAVRPDMFFHAHMHVYGDLDLDDGRRIIALSRDTMAGNAGILDMATLEFEPLSLAEIRGWRS